MRDSGDEMWSSGKNWRLKVFGTKAIFKIDILFEDLKTLLGKVEHKRNFDSTTFSTFFFFISKRGD